MKKAIYVTVLFVFTLVSINVQAQMKISTTSDVIDPSLVLEVDNSDNKGVLFPQMNFGTALDDTTFPVPDPAEGLIIYNKSDDGPQLYKEGYYIFFDGKWRYIADNNNAVTDLTVVSTSLNETILGTTYDTFVDCRFPLSEFSNSINLSHFDKNTGFTFLPPGDYTIQLVIEFEVAGIGTGLGKGINMMAFQSQLYDQVSDSVLDTTLKNVDLLNSGTDTAIGTAIGTMEFNFSFHSDVNTEIIPKIAHLEGGTFINPITIKQYKMHIQISK